MDAPEQAITKPAAAPVYPDEHRSRVVRAVLLVVGVIAFAAGVLGVFLPLLPATPLFLVAAACFARAYRPFHEWMLANSVIGPQLRDWYLYRSIPYRTKMVAILTMLLSFGTSIYFFVRPRWLQVVLALVALALATWLYRIPSRERTQAPTT